MSHILKETCSCKRNVAIVEMKPTEVFSIGITLVDVHLNWPNWLHFPILDEGLLIIPVDYMIFLSPLLDVARISMSGGGGVEGEYFLKVIFNWRSNIT